jgi:hypothetical protein
MTLGRTVGLDLKRAVQAGDGCDSGWKGYHSALEFQRTLFFLQSMLLEVGSGEGRQTSASRPASGLAPPCVQ